jgi:hypothetical protein
MKYNNGVNSLQQNFECFPGLLHYDDWHFICAVSPLHKICVIGLNVFMQALLGEDKEAMRNVSTKMAMITGARRHLEAGHEKYILDTIQNHAAQVTYFSHEIEVAFLSPSCILKNGISVDINNALIICVSGN